MIVPTAVNAWNTIAHPDDPEESAIVFTPF
jgi:hypothetical protein